VIVLTIVIAFVVAFNYLRLVTPVYVSTARIRVEPLRSDPTVFMAIHWAQVNIIKAALDDPNMLTLSGSADPGYMNDLAATLTASWEANSDIIRLSASSPYREDAAKFVNAVVKAFAQRLEDEDEARRHSADALLEVFSKELEHLGEELEKRRNQLDEKRKELSLFQEQHPGAEEADVNSELQVNYINLVHQCDLIEEECGSIEDVCRSIRQRIEEIRVLSVSTVDIHVLEYAEPARRPLRSDKVSIRRVGTFLRFW
jgi:uncharacterized protein involved in exopolysaccharide biosynthesis